MSCLDCDCDGTEIRYWVQLKNEKPTRRVSIDTIDKLDAKKILDDDDKLRKAVEDMVAKSFPEYPQTVQKLSACSSGEGDTHTDCDCDCTVRPEQTGEWTMLTDRLFTRKVTYVDAKGASQEREVGGKYNAQIRDLDVYCAERKIIKTVNIAFIPFDADIASVEPAPSADAIGQIAGVLAEEEKSRG